jgi:hypothetical protein
MVYTKELCQELNISIETKYIKYILNIPNIYLKNISYKHVDLLKVLKDVLKLFKNY